MEANTVKTPITAYDIAFHVFYKPSTLAELREVDLKIEGDLVRWCAALAHGSGLIVCNKGVYSAAPGFVPGD